MSIEPTNGEISAAGRVAEIDTLGIFATHLKCRGYEAAAWVLCADGDAMPLIGIHIPIHKDFHFNFIPVNQNIRRSHATKWSAAMYPYGVSVFVQFDYCYTMGLGTPCPVKFSNQSRNAAEL
jgi:hypothetical protein